MSVPLDTESDRHHEPPPIERALKADILSVLAVTIPTPIHLSQKAIGNKEREKIGVNDPKFYLVVTESKKQLTAKIETMKGMQG